MANREEQPVVWIPMVTVGKVWDDHTHDMALGTMMTMTTAWKSTS